MGVANLEKAVMELKPELEHLKKRGDGHESKIYSSDSATLYSNYTLSNKISYLRRKND